MKKNELIVIRPYQLDDRNLIFATFLRGLYFGGSIYSTVPKNIFMKEHHKIIENILSNPETEVRIACDKDMPSMVYGYSITGPEKIHWVHIKKPYRGIGLAKDLIPPGMKYATHLNEVGFTISRKMNLDFNPYAVS